MMKYQDKSSSSNGTRKYNGKRNYKYRKSRVELKVI